MASKLFRAGQSVGVTANFRISFSRSSRSWKLAPSSLVSLRQNTPDIEPFRTSRLAADPPLSLSLKFARKPLGRPDRAFAARCAVGRRVKKIAGLALVGTNGTPLILGEFVLPAFISGPQPNVYAALVGRHIPI